MRKGIVFCWLFFLLLGVVSIFWRMELVYHLPTPVPKDYLAVSKGTYIDLSSVRSYLPAAAAVAGKQPLFLHFFNPDCPCSRFNIPHFKSLVREYGGRAQFAVVLVTAKEYTAGEVRKRFDLDPSISILKDTAIEKLCGVYSTPQAVIIDTSDNLFYRGNYNRSRYCTDAKTSYAKTALEAIFNHDLNPVFSPLALRAYGCQLPTCNQ